MCPPAPPPAARPPASPSPPAAPPTIRASPRRHRSDWYLTGRAALYRQTIVTSSFASPDLLGLLSKR
jgi:hypothetical protein